MDGKRLKALREARELTQKELAAILDVERTSIGKYELKDITPNAVVLKKMADFFNVSVDYLLGREDQDTHYHDPEVAEMINAAHKDPDLRVLFSASKKLTKDELQAVLSMIKVMSKEG